MIMRQEKKTFVEIYEGVRMWCTGRQTPDALAQSVISKELGVPEEVLFPEDAPQFGPKKKEAVV